MTHRTSKFGRFMPLMRIRIISMIRQIYPSLEMRIATYCMVQPLQYTIIVQYAVIECIYISIAAAETGILFWISVTVQTMGPHQMYDNKCIFYPLQIRHSCR